MQIDDTEIAAEIQSRLDRLERRNRRLKALLVAGLLFIGVLTAMAAAPAAVKDEVRARKFIAEDERHERHATLDPSHLSAFTFRARNSAHVANDEGEPSVGAMSPEVVARSDAWPTGVFRVLNAESADVIWSAP